MPRLGDCRPLEDRFWEKVLIAPFYECWEWSAFCNSLGYGMFRIGKRMPLAHRVSYELNIGAIPNGLLICHKCDNPRCVRPEHLYAGTDADNSRDRVSRGRSFRPIGEKSHRAKLTESLAKEIRASNLSHNKAAAHFNISRGAVRDIRLRRSWTHID